MAFSCSGVNDNRTPPSATIKGRRIAYGVNKTVSKTTKTNPAANFKCVTYTRGKTVKKTDADFCDFQGCNKN